MAPIHAGDTISCARAYARLGWYVARGERYRPRSRCTCPEAAACPTPGAHPRPGALTPLGPDTLAAELTAAPGASLIGLATHFDAITLPRQAGMAAMVAIDRIAPVPCIVTAEQATLLVLPATARYAFDGGNLPGVEVCIGPDQWVALPPSHGARWDTPPWDEQTGAPVQLLHGRALRGVLVEALAHSRPSKVHGS